MAKRFQTNSQKAAARERATEHLSGSGKPKKGGGKAEKQNDTKLELNGGTNPKASEESILLHFNEILKRKKTAATSNSRVRSQNAVAKKDNVDTNLLGKVVAFADRDPRDVEAELAELLRYVGVCVPDVQLELFEEGAGVTREAQIFDAGYRAGRDARKNQADNPHGKGSIEHEIWADGYSRGQQKNASLIGKTAARDSLGPVPGAKPENGEGGAAAH